jgi:hypothetical protein
VQYLPIYIEKQSRGIKFIKMVQYSSTAQMYTHTKFSTCHRELCVCTHHACVQLISCRNVQATRVYTAVDLLSKFSTRTDHWAISVTVVVISKLTLVCDPWFVGCKQGAGINCTPVAFQHPLIRLRFLFFSLK